jgi:hemoglobin
MRETRQETRRDITGREDIEKLIIAFYNKVRKDELLAPVFLKVDWEHHTPIIIDFWCMVLFGDQNYKGNPFHKHIPLPIQQPHFEKWLKYFTETVDEIFEGKKADELKDRANNIANIFQYKLGLMPKN